MNDKKLRLYTPVFLVFFILLFFYAIYIRTWVAALQSFAISVFYALGACEVSRWLVIKGRENYPGITHVEKRLLYVLLRLIPFLLLVPLANEVLTFVIGYNPIDNIKVLLVFYDYIYMVGLFFLCSLVVIALYEGLYYIESWKTLFAESERLKKSNLNSQYQFLKDQVKPHFLFNSLNTLTSLISIDAVRAEQFVVEMSAVYRYLLTKKEKELSTLAEEINFLNSYVLMLKTRFGNSLKVDFQIHPVDYHYLLPPFVLQLLVENAVKHNIVSSEKPLSITISTDDNHQLIVTNNIQLKPKPEPSEKTGLTNLMLRYQLLKKEDQLSITDNDGIFKVLLPLIETDIYEPVNV